MFTRSLLQGVVCGFLCLLPIACAGPRPTTVPPVAERERFPGRGIYKVGEPYQIKGIWYYPHEDYSYRETGVASWYGMDFHGKETANSEVFDMNALTAAHRTLPMPSMVQVTNLTNGRAVAVRVNDRGPFVNDRVIDLSRRAAQLLGFYTQGTTRVRVEVLVEESFTLKSQLFLRNTIMAGDQMVEAAPGDAVVAKPRGLLPVLDSPLTPPPSSPQAKISGPTVSHARSMITVDVPLVVPANRVAERPRVFSTFGYYIQVASFGRSALAHQAFRQLKGIDHVNLVLQPQDSRMLYHLRIGPLAERLAAERLLAYIRKVGYADAWIIGGEWQREK